MSVDKAIKNLKTSNQELKITTEQLGDQFEDLRADPRFSGLVDDLENLAVNYLKTWIKTNTEVIKMLSKK